MTMLPLFPLNTVLFPRMPISLHIFEERYKLMIGRCIADRQPFGVVLLRHGAAEQQVRQKIVPYTVGCTAHITQVQSVGEGRMNIVAVGHERFHILDFDHSQPYLTGNVEMIPFSKDDIDAFAGSAQRLRPLVERYVTIVSESENVQFDPNQLPKDPVQLAYLSATLLRTDMEDKQKILDSRNATEMLTDLVSLYRKETALLHALVKQPSENPDTRFSLN